MKARIFAVELTLVKQICELVDDLSAEIILKTLIPFHKNAQTLIKVRNGFLSVACVCIFFLGVLSHFNSAIQSTVSLNFDKRNQPNAFFSRLMELCNFRALYDIAKSLEFKSICSIEMFVCICKRIADVSKWRTGGWKSLLSISYYIALHTCKYNNTELKKRNGKNRKMFGCAVRTGCSVRVIAVVLFELGAFKQPTYHIHTYPLPCHAML